MVYVPLVNFFLPFVLNILTMKLLSTFSIPGITAYLQKGIIKLERGRDLSLERTFLISNYRTVRGGLKRCQTRSSSVFAQACLFLQVWTLGRLVIMITNSMVPST